LDLSKTRKSSVSFLFIFFQQTNDLINFYSAESVRNPFFYTYTFLTENSFKPVLFQYSQPCFWENRQKLPTKLWQISFRGKSNFILNHISLCFSEISMFSILNKIPEKHNKINYLIHESFNKFNHISNTFIYRCVFNAYTSTYFIQFLNKI